MAFKYIIGIDEVGRGPLAGPVCVCAFSLTLEFQSSIIKFQEDFKLPLRDSKKLSEAQREKWFAQIKEWKKEGAADYAFCFVSAVNIDKFGISSSIKKALSEALLKLKSDPENSMILLDGGLSAPEEYKNQKTIIKGDEKEASIALASIVAKVSRDNVMKQLSKKMPDYQFEKNKGYGTKAHIEAIKKFGTTSEHRISFLGNFINK